VDFRILGRPDVYHEGERVDIGAPKQRTVLAALLLSTNEALSTDRLMDSVWSRPPAAASANLRVYLSGLRRILHVPGERGSRLRTLRAGGYRLSVHPGELDLQRFDALADRGEEALRAGQLPAAAEHLEQALRLWHGRALDGVVYGPALESIVLRLEERRLAVAELWTRARLDLGQPESVVTELRALVREHPMRERLWGHLMRALCQSGRPGEALVAYAELRSVLAGELGVDPGPELRELHERILHWDDSVTRPAPVTPVAAPRRLPAGPSALFGRTEEPAGPRQTPDGAGHRAGPVVVAALRRLAGACLALADRADARLSADFLGKPEKPEPKSTRP
jgi:DNA-binding SARP family transcriptional activator